LSEIALHRGLHVPSNEPKSRWTNILRGMLR
jgi:hypothetical protein